jgi:hypothetical protein
MSQPESQCNAGLFCRSAGFPYREGKSGGPQQNRSPLRWLVGTKTEGRYKAPLRLQRDRVAQGVGGRHVGPWFRIHPAERRVRHALPLHLVIPYTRSNGALGCVTWR